jgi:hypothetical protein
VGNRWRGGLSMGIDVDRKEFRINTAIYGKAKIMFVIKFFVHDTNERNLDIHKYRLTSLLHVSTSLTPSSWI